VPDNLIPTSWIWIGVCNLGITARYITLIAILPINEQLQQLAAITPKPEDVLS
jgi:hypothetical protein